MGYLLKQNQTSQPLLFLMVLASDHVSPATGLTPTVTISKNGGAFASPAGAVTEIANGWYKVAGNATDENTLGPLLLHATGAAADPADERYDVVAFDPQSATNMGLSYLGGDAFTRLGAPAAASVSADLAAVAAKTANLPSSPAAVGSAMTLSSGERNTIADVILTRDWLATVAAIVTIPARCLLNALRPLRNRWTISGSVLSVKAEDDSTEAWNATLSSDATATPVIGSDPS